MGTTPATFNGSSTYAADLQQNITHAVAIASIPLNQLNANVTALQGQSTELGYLQNGFVALQNAIASLTTGVTGGGLSASVSDNTIATANLNSSSAVDRRYVSLNVISAGSPTTSVSNTGLPTVADPSATSISTSSTYTLTRQWFHLYGHSIDEFLECAGAGDQYVGRGSECNSDQSRISVGAVIQSFAAEHGAREHSDPAQRRHAGSSHHSIDRHASSVPSEWTARDADLFGQQHGYAGAWTDGQLAPDRANHYHRGGGFIRGHYRDLVFRAAYNATVDELATNRGTAGRTAQRTKHRFLFGADASRPHQFYRRERFRHQPGRSRTYL